jgi:hypothetical protein
MCYHKYNVQMIKLPKQLQTLLGNASYLTLGFIRFWMNLDIFIQWNYLTP